MAEIIGEGKWSPVRQLETYELARGGINGNMNEQAKALVERTEYLKQNSASKDDLNAMGQGNFSFDTREIALIKIQELNIQPNTKIEISKEGEFSGPYQWDGVELTPSEYTPVKQANVFTIQKIAESEIGTDKKIESIQNASVARKADDPKIISFGADAHGYSLAYYDKEKECFVGAGLLESVFKLVSQLKVYEDERYIYGGVDSQGRMLWGWDKLLDRFVCGETFSSQPPARNYYYFEQAQQIGTVNHMLWYGESYTMGAAASVVLSTSQNYGNLTFNTGPRKDTEATSIIPLREFFYAPSIDGYYDRGETCCSGSANYASVSIMKNRGIDPKSHVIFSSTAGHGSYKLSNLTKGTPWYPKLLEHVTKAKQLINDPGYTPQVINFVQGANDAAAASRTPKSVYKPMLVQLQIDAETDIKATSGKDNPIRFMIAQMSYGTAAHKDMAMSHLELCQESDKFMLVTPMYHFPYADDKVHLTNVGSKWMSAYFGRAYDQYVFEQRKPDFINPLHAHVDGNKIFIKFDVPTLPLQLDEIQLAKTTDYGFKVMQGTSSISITSINTINDTVVLQLSSTPTDNIKIRYGLDYLGTGLIFTEGASGNLRDSTPEQVVIDGTVKPLFHVCPHFELTAFLDKGI